MWQKLSKCYPPQLELIALFLLLLAFYIALSNYSILPDTIPVHFNAQGIPDNWGSKRMVFLYPGLNAFIYVSFTALNIWFATTKDPKSLINLPQKRKAVLSNAQAEELRTFLNRCLFLLKVIIQGLTIYLVYITIELAWGRVNSLGQGFFLFIAAIIGVAGFMVWKAFHLTRIPSQR